MSEVKSAWRDAASVVARATEHTDHPEQAVGLIRQISLHEGDGEAQVMFGFTPDLIPIASTNWFRVFADQVRADASAGVVRVQAAGHSRVDGRMTGETMVHMATYFVHLVGGPSDGITLPLEEAINDDGPELDIPVGGVMYRLTRRLGPASWEANYQEPE